MDDDEFPMEEEYFYTPLLEPEDRQQRRTVSEGTPSRLSRLSAASSRILAPFDGWNRDRLPSTIGPEESVDNWQYTRIEDDHEEMDVGRRPPQLPPRVPFSAGTVDGCSPASPVSGSSLDTVRRGPAPSSSTAQVDRRPGDGQKKRVAWAPLPDQEAMASGSRRRPSPYKTRCLVGNFIPVSSSPSPPTTTTTNTTAANTTTTITTTNASEPGPNRAKMAKKTAVSPQKDDRGRAGPTNTTNCRGTAGGIKHPPQSTPLRARSRSPTKGASGSSRPAETHFAGVSETDDGRLSRSSGEILIGLAPSAWPFVAGDGQRGARGNQPAPINTALARVYGASRMVAREGGQRSVVTHHPTERELSPERAASQVATLGIVAGDPNEGWGAEAGEQPGSAGVSSVYSRNFSPATAPHPTVAQSLCIEDYPPSMSKTDRDRSVVAHYPSAVSPLRVGKGDGVTAPYPKHVSVLEEYERWRESTTPEVGKNQHQGDGRSASSGSAAPARVPSSALMAEDSVGIDANRHSRTYSPITPLVPVEQLEALRGRVASKTLIGENGWLEDTSKGPNPPSAPPSKGRLFLNRFKSKAKDVMTGGSTSFSVGPSSSTRAGGLLRSLNPREQSLLVCELDFAIASALEAYIESQFVRGRVSLAAIKKIADNWARKGRPKVIGFRYDIETQIEIVKLHINDFKFCGRYATNPVIVGVLDSMRMTARSMAVRTYCYPDTVISMWLTDARKLFELMGTGEREVCGIIGIHAFFSSVVLREQQKAEQSQTLDSVGVQGAGFAELDPLPPLARSKSQPQKREKPEQPAKEEKPQYQKHSQQASYPSQEQPHSQQHQYQERPQEYQYQGHPQQQKFQERSQQHQYHWCQEDENTRPSDALRSEYNSSPLKSPRKTGRKNYGSLEKDEPEYVTSSPAKAYDSTFSHQAYGSTSSRPAYGSASSHQAHGSSAQHSQQGPSNISQPRQKITKITDLAALRSTPRKIADWDYETPYQNLSNIDRSRSSPTKKYSTTTSPTKGFFFTASPTKKEQPDNSHWSSESRSQRRRELLQPIMKKYDSPKEDLPSPKRQANAQAYMDHQASSSSRRLPISTSEKTLKTSHSVQNSLNERELREQREVARERERELYHQQNLMRCARSRFGEEEDDDDDMF